MLLCVFQNEFETVTKEYITDYLSVANRDILVTEKGSYVQRYVYDNSGSRISVELDYAEGTNRANGEGGKNPASDFAANATRKVWCRRNSLGSSLYAVDENSEVIVHMSYDVWGSPTEETYLDMNFVGIDNLNNFTGYTYDETLRLYYAQNRFYDAETRRFTQQDLVKDGVNWYAYCGADPVNATDPDGLKIKLEGTNEEKINFRKTMQKLTSDGLTTIGGYVETYTPRRTPPSRYPVGTELIRELIDHPKTVTVKGKKVEYTEMNEEIVIGAAADADNRENAVNNNGSAATVHFDQKVVAETIVIREIDKKGNISKEIPVDYITLGHELIHAYHMLTGTMSYYAQDDNDPTSPYFNNKTQMGLAIYKDEKGKTVYYYALVEELRTAGVSYYPALQCGVEHLLTNDNSGRKSIYGELVRYDAEKYTENALRAEHGLPLRTEYSVYKNRELSSDEAALAKEWTNDYVFISIN